MSLIAGLRDYSIGNDTVNYLRNYNLATTNGIAFFGISRMEPGYVAMNLLFSGAGAGFNVFLFVVSLLINLAVGFLIIRYSKNPTASFLFFILFRFFFSEMNIMRQLLSMAIIMYGLPFIENRKPVKFLLIVLLAATFHFSAIIAFVLYFLYADHYKNTTIALMAIGTLIVSLSLGGILNALTAGMGAYEGYVDSYMDSNRVGNVLQFGVFLLVFCYLRCVYNLHKKNVERNKMYGFLLNVALVCVLLSFLSIRISIMSRIVDYFSVFMIISIPYFTSLIRNPKRRAMAFVLTTVFAFCYFLTITYFRPNWNNVLPYKFYWD